MEPLAGLNHTRQHLRVRELITDNPEDARTYVILRSRVVDRTFSRLLSSRLDTALAAGRAPETSRLYAARADHLVSQPFRAELADNWDRVVDIATGRQAASAHRRAVLRKDRVVDAQQRIRELTALLRAPMPVPARGVAAAHVLLTDGMGPLYSPVCTATLSDEVARAVAGLGPAPPPMS